MLTSLHNHKNDPFGPPPSLSSIDWAHTFKPAQIGPSTLPTPALIKAARALAASGDKPTAPPITRPAIINATTNLTNISSSFSSAATQQQQQDTQSRALAAQAAHHHQQQRRLAASEAAKSHCGITTATGNEAPPPFQFGVGFTGFGNVPFGKTRHHHYPGVIGQGLPNTLEIPERYLDLVEELQVDLSLPVVSATSPQGEVSTQFTSPSAEVDISAFIPPPGPKPLIATEATIEASAVPLSDWAAEFCWMLINRPSISADLMTMRRPTVAANPRFASFRSWCSTTLNATLPSPQVLIFGLYYLSKLPLGSQAAVKHYNDCLNMTTPGVQEFRKALYGEGEREINKVAKLAMTLGLVLGNKWLEDNTFTNRTWYEVTHLSRREIRLLEISALKCLDFSLHVPDNAWAQWLIQLRSFTAVTSDANSIGAIGTRPSAQNVAPFKCFDHLIAIAKTRAEDPSSIEDTLNTMDGERMEKQALDAITDEEEADDMVLFPRSPPTTTRGRRPFIGPLAPIGYEKKTSRPRMLSEMPMDLDSPPFDMMNAKVASIWAPVCAPIQRPVAPLVIHSRRSSLTDLPSPPGLEKFKGVNPPRPQRPYYVEVPAQVQATYQAHHSPPWQQRERAPEVMVGWPKPSSMDWSTTSGIWGRGLTTYAG